MTKKNKKITVKAKPVSVQEISWRYHALALCLIVVFAFGVYANSLKGEFIWDDKDLILENQYVKDLHYLPLLFAQDFFYHSHDQVKIGYYRPIIALSYMLDYRLWKVNPAGYHLTNIIFHCSNSLLIYLIMLFLSGSLILSFLSALLFAIHPIHTESVAWISGRTDVIAGFFFFSSLLLYLYWEKVKRWWFYACSLLLFALALLSKEMVMTLPLLVMVYDYYFVAGREWGKMKGRVKHWAGYFILIALYFMIRLMILKVGTGNPHVEGLNRLNVVLTFGKGFLYYFWKLLVPFNLNAYVILELGSFTQAGVWAGFILIGGLAVAGLRSQSGRISFGIGFFLISLLLLTNLIPINAPVDIDFPLAERFLYIPSFGFCLVLGVLIGNGVRLDRWKAGGMVFLLCLFYSYSTFARNRDWRDEESFYQVTAKSSPRSSLICNNLGVVFNSKGRYDEAMVQFKKAIELNPLQIEAYSNLGHVYHDKGFYKEAMAYYQEALKLSPDHVKARHNLGTLYNDLGRYDLAEREFKIVLQSRSDLPETHNNLGDVYRSQKRYQEAMKEFHEALKFKPDFAEPYYNLGNVYRDLSQYENALWAYQEAIKIKPQFTEASFNLGVLYTNRGLFKEAERAYLQTLRFRPQYAPAHRNLGVIYLYQLGNREGAIYHLAMTLKIEPNQYGAEEVRRALKELAG